METTRFIVTVKRNNMTAMTYRCDNEIEVAALEGAFYAMYYPLVTIRTVDSGLVGRELAEAIETGDAALAA